MPAADEVLRCDAWLLRPGRIHLRLRVVSFLEIGGGDPAGELARIEKAVRGADGEVVQAMHGLVLATFGSASGCLVACASVPPTVRGGVSCGDLLYEEALVHGLPVIEASRLKEAADAGCILWADRVRRLALLPGAVFGPPRALALQGLPVPLAASELLRDPEALAKADHPGVHAREP